MRATVFQVPVILAATLLAAAPAGAQDFHWSGRLAAGKRLEIKGVNGSIRTTAAAGDEIDVSAHKTARHSDPDEVKITVVPTDEGVTICAVYPTPRRADRENSCEPASCSAGRPSTARSMPRAWAPMPR
jgi:hypothetical protein